MLTEREQGAALILSLLLLLILTLLAISSMQNTVMQERMVSSEREGIVSLEIAESALRDGEIFLEGINALSVLDGSNGLYGMADATPNPITSATWSGNGVRDANAVNGVTPRYFIQHIGEAKQNERITDIVLGNYTHDTGASTTHAFRIVAWSPGSSGESNRVIESYYARDF